MSPDRIVELTAEQTHPLRRTVLREGTASDEFVFDGDELAATWHLGVVRAGAIVAISTWIDREHPARPGRPAVQLRGMATAPQFRGEGVGTRLLAAGLARCRGLGADLVWARARVTAIGFYRRHGFEVDSDEYIDATTGLPHRDIVRDLR